MEFRLLSILAFLFIVLMVSEAALPPEIYWKKMLPNTEMPKAVKNSLPKPEWMEEESTSVNVGKGGVHVNTGSKQGGGTAVNVGPHKGVNFSVQPNSDEAKVIQETIKGCEEKGIQGEQKYCATSLESLVDYAKNSLGKNVKAMSTESKTIDDKVQKYTITAVKKVAYDNEAAVCHKQKYAYAVFYCHKTKDTSAYTVSLMGADGSKAKAMAVCHKDTSAWNPKHLAFQALNVKPGSVPVCHFLPEEHIVWVPNN
uniref:BURP domain-containing protein n=1 Tax=Chenopodium quinoa TaxID=63459 RepID=A0A803NER6_CHEQI